MVSFCNYIFVPLLRYQVASAFCRLATKFPYFDARIYSNRSGILTLEIHSCHKNPVWREDFSACSLRPDQDIVIINTKSKTWDTFCSQIWLRNICRIQICNVVLKNTNSCALTSDSHISQHLHLSFPKMLEVVPQPVNA